MTQNNKKIFYIKLLLSHVDEFFIIKKIINKNYFLFKIQHANQPINECVGSDKKNYGLDDESNPLKFKRVG